MFNYAEAIRLLLHFGALFLMVAMFACLVGAVRGPKLADRIIAINMISVKAILLVVLLGVSIEFDALFLIDIALVYALLSFLAVVILARFMLQVKLNKARKNADEAKRGD